MRGGARSSVRVVGEFVVEAERFADHAAVDAVVRRAFAHHPGVADMVAAIRGSPRYRPGLALVARIGPRVVGFVMLSGTDLVDDTGTRREVPTARMSARITDADPDSSPNRTAASLTDG